MLNTARYVNEPVSLQSDTEPGPRGKSVKVTDVEWERLGKIR